MTPAELWAAMKDIPPLLWPVFLVGLGIGARFVIPILKSASQPDPFGKALGDLAERIEAGNRVTNAKIDATRDELREKVEDMHKDLLRGKK